jgi:hypothetical protein
MDRGHGWTKEDRSDLRRLSVIIASDGKKRKFSILSSAKMNILAVFQANFDILTL